MPRDNHGGHRLAIGVFHSQGTRRHSATTNEVIGRSYEEIALPQVTTARIGVQVVDNCYIIDPCVLAR